MPANDVVARMVEIYDARYLAYQHLRASSDVARRIIPDTDQLELPAAVLRLISSVYDFADDKLDRQLIVIARDGVIDDVERRDFDRIVTRLDAIIQAALAVAYNGC